MNIIHWKPGHIDDPPENDGSDISAKPTNNDKSIITKFPIDDVFIQIKNLKN